MELATLPPRTQASLLDTAEERLGAQQKTPPQRVTARVKYGDCDELIMALTRLLDALIAK